PAEIMGVVGGHHADAQLLAQAQHPLLDDPLVGDAVLLHLQPEAIPTEHAREPLGAAPGLLVLPLAEMQRDLAREAGGETDDPLAVLLQAFLVDARAPVESLDVADRGQADEVLVAGAAPGEKNEMAVGGRGAARLLPRLAGSEG